MTTMALKPELRFRPSLGRRGVARCAGARCPATTAALCTRFGRRGSTAGRRVRRAAHRGTTSASSTHQPTPSGPGYRACLRCEPADRRARLRSRDAVAETRALPRRGRPTGPCSLAELATRAGLSASHLQRSFKRLVGVSPREYQDGASRVDRFKTRLRSGDTVSRATYEAGFGSSSRVYERADAMLGMTPASYRRGGAGLVVRYTIADAPVGRVLVATTERGVCAVELGATNADVERALARRFPQRDDRTRRRRARDMGARRARSRSRSATRSRSITFHSTFTARRFSGRCGRHCWTFPLGERRSYAEVAAAIGRPRATRAVARACATNRVAVVIPCHRVVRARRRARRLQVGRRTQAAAARRRSTVNQALQTPHSRGCPSRSSNSRLWVAVEALYARRTTRAASLLIGQPHDSRHPSPPPASFSSPDHPSPRSRGATSTPSTGPSSSPRGRGSRSAMVTGRFTCASHRAMS